ncbi:inner centromere protein Mis6 [Schizosaccharomyces japonicus yFS275]|uniref:Inner centromere protein Mis6 n=1 Tax=Schizosaccharomyces japonicus (strain yFS275 / FY16936) TaxID=402676 RepID=B6JWB0_SCHJY|nr:inner centromere protein Mis6 [Schizosaccharomyces japonicus yFS275]EEB05661.1 inner centromere protein Mis6 [Schizosaccharomyces japonicus yFS275]
MTETDENVQSRTTFASFCSCLDAYSLPPKAQLKSIKELYEYVKTVGLSNAEIGLLLSVVLGQKESPFSQGNRVKLIHCLLPTEPVSEDIQLRIVSALDPTGRRVPWTIQTELLRWMMHVFHVCSSTNVLSRNYGILFHFLEFQTFRPYVCPLLVWLTRRKNVRTFRIHHLLALYNRPGNYGDPYLLELIITFKKHYPDVIVGTYEHTKAFSFQWDETWLARLQDILQNAAPLKHALKRLRADSIFPPLQTLQVKPNESSLEENHTAKELSNCIERLKFPSHIASIIAAPPLSQLAFLIISQSLPELSARLDFWVAGALHQAIRDGLHLSYSFHQLSLFLSISKQTMPRTIRLLVDALHQASLSKECVKGIYSVLSSINAESILQYGDEILTLLFKSFLDNDHDPSWIHETEDLFFQWLFTLQSSSQKELGKTIISRMLDGWLETVNRQIKNDTLLYTCLRLFASISAIEYFADIVLTTPFADFVSRATFSPFPPCREAISEYLLHYPGNDRLACNVQNAFLGKASKKGVLLLLRNEQLNLDSLFSNIFNKHDQGSSPSFIKQLPFSNLGSVFSIQLLAHTFRCFTDVERTKLITLSKFLDYELRTKSNEKSRFISSTEQTFSENFNKQLPSFLHSQGFVYFTRFVYAHQNTTTRESELP